MMRKVVLLILLSGIWYCSKSPEELMEMGREALAEENAILALEHYKAAYEKSFTDEFFYLDRDEIYNDVKLSATGNLLLATRINNAKGHTTLYVYNPEEDDTWTKTLPEIVLSSSLSPAGKYLILVSKNNEGNCYISVWDVKEEEKFPFMATTGCYHHPAISDSGLILFYFEEKIASYDLTTEKTDAEFIAKTPDAPVNDMPAWAHIQFSPDNKPFMTYGAAGIYKLYYLGAHDLNLLSKEGATGKIYFYPNRRQVGIITGGADNHKFVFFTYTGDPVKEYPVRLWKDAAFSSEDVYYYVDGNRVFLHRDDKETDLPFFADQIFLTSSGELIIFEKPGKILRYSGVLPGKQTLDVFQLVNDLRE